MVQNPASNWLKSTSTVNQPQKTVHWKVPRRNLSILLPYSPSVQVPKCKMYTPKPCNYDTETMHTAYLGPLDTPIFKVFWPDQAGNVTLSEPPASDMRDFPTQRVHALLMIYFGLKVRSLRVSAAYGCLYKAGFFSGTAYQKSIYSGS